ncbi:hypothetical protein J6590_019397 [Homalodisca vitripennis]|nr:hypothetical protein J6590_019397 [Homalodisca vitripennis]
MHLYDGTSSSTNETESVQILVPRREREWTFLVPDVSTTTVTVVVRGRGRGSKRAAGNSSHTLPETRGSGNLTSRPGQQPVKPCLFANRSIVVDRRCLQQEWFGKTFNEYKIVTSTTNQHLPKPNGFAICRSLHSALLLHSRQLGACHHGEARRGRMENWKLQANEGPHILQQTRLCRLLWSVSRGAHRAFSGDKEISVDMSSATASISHKLLLLDPLTSLKPPCFTPRIEPRYASDQMHLHKYNPVIDCKISRVL